MIVPVRNLFVLIGILLTLQSVRTSAVVQSSEIKTPVRVRTVDSAAIDGRLISLSQGGGLNLEVDGEHRIIPTADLISIVRTDAEAQSEQWGRSIGRDGVALEMVGGDRVIGRVGDSASDSVSVETEQWGILAVPLERLAGMLFSAGGSPAFADSVRWFRRDSDSVDDRLLLTNGDVVRGFIAGVSREGVQLEIGDEVNTVPLRLAVAARLVHPPADRLKGLHAAISLRDGQRLTVVEWDWAGGRISAKAASGESVAPAFGELRSIAFQGGRWEWLSARNPSSSQHIPMLSVEWKHVLDGSVLGGPLRVAGEPYEKGIGVHSKSVLAYELDGAYREFVTSFGMDDQSGRMANAQAVIMVDGQQRFERSDVVAGMLHGPIRVDVTGARRLELVVDFGLNGDIQDRFDWIEPGLVK